MKKFLHEKITNDGETRASVTLKSLDTLWFNTGTLCNLTCENCYIESSPTNDRLSFLTALDVKSYLEEIKSQSLGTKLIGLTGGEPFLNPHIIAILKLILDNGFEVLVLTNANRVLKKHHQDLLQLKEKFAQKLHLRVSLDHYTDKVHDEERGPGAFEKTREELVWLSENSFNISIAGRSLIEESREKANQGYVSFFKENNLNIDPSEKLVIFPEMKSERDVPEITIKCWDILGKSPDDQMCANERMIVKRKGEDRAVVMPCTLLAYDQSFVLGNELRNSKKEVFLNHRFCAEFCVLGGASCSTTK